jgi:PAS domain S-box-containing protein
MVHGVTTTSPDGQFRAGDVDDVRLAVIVVDTRGVIVHWSAGASSLLGYAADEVVGSTLDVIVPAEHRDAHWKGFRRAMTDPRPRDLAADLPVVLRDGRVLRLAGRLIVLTDGLGRAAGAVGVFTDAGTTGNRPFG